MMTHTQMHIIQLAPWPITMSFGMLGMMLSMVHWFQYNSHLFFIIPLVLIIMSMIGWWRDVIRESTFLGNHNNFVQTALMSGMILFIMTEVMFFSSFFWMYFHIGLIPSHNIGMLWPSVGIQYLNPFTTPLLNTGILLLSGVSVTWAHEEMTDNNLNMFSSAMLSGVNLGVLFTYLQYTEYLDSSFDITDSAIGSALFVATGFHGAHVIIGSIFLIIVLFRGIHNQFSSLHLVGFEMAAWYWHFVDVVWLYLYVCMYWWLST